MKFCLGNYEFDLPRNAVLSGQVTTPPTDDVGTGGLSLIALVGRFRFSFSLDSHGTPSDLAEFIFSSTKDKPVVQQVEINGIAGVTYGSYNPSRTWFDWYLKRGETMLCINLQSDIDPLGRTIPTAEEVASHRAIIESIQYVPS